MHGRKWRVKVPGAGHPGRGRTYVVLCLFPPPTPTVLFQMINMEPGYGRPVAVIGNSFQSEGPKGKPNDERQNRTGFSESSSWSVDAMPCHAMLWYAMLSRFSRVRLFVTPWTVARQASLSMDFSRQEHWSGLPCPPPGDHPYSGIEPTYLTSPALSGGFFYH